MPKTLLVRESVWCVCRNNKGKFLLLKRSKSANHPSEWNFPGGNIDEGESPKIAGSREFKEEAGVFIPSWMAFLSITSKDRLMHYIRPSMPMEIKKVHLNGESSDYDWVAPKELHKLNLHYPTQQYFNHLTNKDLLKFRKQLVKSDLFMEIQATIQNDVVGKAMICIPTRKLHDVQINADYRGLGYADSLMKYLMSLPNNPTQLTAYSNDKSGLSTQDLVSFYGKYGFIPSGVTAGNYKLQTPIPMIYKNKTGK